MITFFPEKAITPARLIALNVFPSPEMVDVTANILGSFSIEIN
jgi:hypothetical protein